MVGKAVGLLVIKTLIISTTLSPSQVSSLSWPLLLLLTGFVIIIEILYLPQFIDIRSGTGRVSPLLASVIRLLIYQDESKLKRARYLGVLFKLRKVMRYVSPSFTS